MKVKIDWKAELIDLIKTMVFSLIVVFLITTFVAKPVKVNGDSMYPQVKDEQVGFSMVFGKNQIERFDIVVVYIEEANKYLVKRVIALPNETVSYKDSQLYINGVAVDEAFLDVTHYLKMYGMSTKELAKKIMQDVRDTIGTICTCGIGTNLYLAKKISWVLGAVFSVFLVLGIFSSCSAMMWIVCQKFSFKDSDISF